MAQGYFYAGRKDDSAVFDYFFRSCPFGGGYVVFAGLADLMEIISKWKFENKELAYLESMGFRREFLEYLSGLSFQFDIHSVLEGEIVFPEEPIVRVEGSLIECQIVESCLLNILNFESLIATKASRIRLVAGDRIFSDFGLRRAQGLGAVYASKAALIGGANSTSNVLAGYLYDLELTGTQAHAWIQSFDNELEAFRNFAEYYPDSTILLVDTYDTLKSGIPNAILVAKEMEDKGHRLKGVRLDSGDLAYLSKKARQMLDREGLDYVRIFASNQLDEYIIRSLISQGASLDGFGIGTRLVTGQPDAALDGVYKLSVANGQPRLKISDQPQKISLAGRKKIFRLTDEEGLFTGDAICLSDEEDPEFFIHPHHPHKRSSTRTLSKELLLRPVMERGEICLEDRSPDEIKKYVRQRMQNLPEEHKRFENPHVYRVGISDKLMNLRDAIVSQIRSKM